MLIILTMTMMPIATAAKTRNDSTNSASVDAPYNDNWNDNKSPKRVRIKRHNSVIDDSVAMTGGASAFQTQSRNCLIVRRRRPSVLTNIAVATDVCRDYTAMCISAASLAFSTCRLCFVFSVCLHAVFSLIVAWLHVVFLLFVAR